MKLTSGDKIKFTELKTGKEVGATYLEKYELFIFNGIEEALTTILVVNRNGAADNEVIYLNQVTQTN